MTDLTHDISRCLFFDIETLETDRESIIAYIDAGIVHPGTMTKAETIEAWVAEKRPDAVREAVGKTALDGGFGRIASIAFALGDGDVKAATSARPASGDVPAAYDRDQEIKVLVRFFEACERIREDLGRPPTLVGHGIIGFDVRWLWKRAIVLGVRPPAWWPVAAKPWETGAVSDTMVAWEGVGGRISQDRLCLALDLPLKTDLDGSKVGDAWKNGEIERVRTYNADDVRTVRAIWKRIVGYVEPAVEVAADPVAEIASEAASVVETVEVAPQPTDRTVRPAGFRPGIKAPAKREEGAAA